MNDRRPIVSLRGLRSLLTFLGSPIDADDVATLEGFWRPLVLITAGTVVTVVKVAGSAMWDYGGVVTSNIWFALPDGRTFILTTAASYGELAAQDAIRAGQTPEPIVGLTWADIACAAMVVPWTIRWRPTWRPDALRCGSTGSRTDWARSRSRCASRLTRRRCEFWDAGPQ